MRPNAKQLSMRDPAMAALMGAFSSDDFGSEFGDELDDALDDYGEEDDYPDVFFDDDYGTEFGAAAGKSRGRMLSRPNAQLVRRPDANALVNIWAKKMRSASLSAKRARILEPNKGSAVKVERYAFTLSQAIVIGTAAAFTTLSGQPDTSIRPQRVTCNAPTPMFAFIQEIKVANVSVTVGAGQEDAFNYNALGVGQALDMPTLSPANRATVLGAYSGFIPPGFTVGMNTFFSVTFKGPSSIVA
jgi:hypothetical protein